MQNGTFHGWDCFGRDQELLPEPLPKGRHPLAVSETLGLPTGTFSPRELKPVARPNSKEAFCLDHIESAVTSRNDGLGKV